MIISGISNSEDHECENYTTDPHHGFEFEQFGYKTLTEMLLIDLPYYKHSEIVFHVGK